MKKILSKRIELLSLFCVVMIAFALYSPTVCHGEELYVDFSPNIINIDSERLGAIRVLTGMGYSFYMKNGGSSFIYFNGCPDSVPNIRATRDSLGNLILRFSLEDLLSLRNCLEIDAYNYPEVVIILNDGAEYIGVGEVNITVKQGIDE